MPLLSPDSDAATLHAGICPEQLLAAHLYIGWCDVCRNYHTAFTGLTQWHSECCFIQVDVEDHADTLGDFGMENFPILLVQ